MKTKVLFGMIVLMLAVTLVIPVMAKPPSGGKGKSNNAMLLLVSKDQNTWEEIWPGPFGLLKYKLSYPSGGFEARLIVHGLEANSWYLVTLQGEWEDPTTPPVNELSDTDERLGSVGYYGVEEKFLDTDVDGEEDFGWADISLFQTDDEGNANVIIPCALPQEDPVYGFLSAPVLPDGTYEEVRVVVKYINTGDLVDWSVMISGGTAILFEHQAMEKFTIEV